MATRSGDRTAADGAERALRFERIREALEEGCYLVDGLAVAGKIVDGAVLSLRRGASARAAGGEATCLLGERASAEFLWCGFLPEGSGRADRGEGRSVPPGECQTK